MEIFKYIRTFTQTHSRTYICVLIYIYIYIYTMVVNKWILFLEKKNNIYIV